MISSRLATYHELCTVYGAKAMYDLIEIATVDNHNRALVRRREEQDR